MKTKADIWIRILGLVLGVSVAAVVVVTSRIPPGTGVIGADIIFASAPTGELSVSPTGPFVSTTDMMPSSAPASGSVDVFNQTGSPLSVAVRGLPSSEDLDTLLMVHVDADNTTLFDGTLGAFRAWTTHTITLDSGKSAKLTVHTWIDPEAGEGWSGRITQIGVEFDSNPVSGKQ